MRITCPKCGISDIDCVYSIDKDSEDNFYMIMSKCNSCKYIGRNFEFWFNNGSAEIIRNTTEVNHTEREIWEKKNI